MAALHPVCPESQLLPDEDDFFPDSPTPIQQRFNPPPSPPPRVRSHYRPFSTLYTESPYIELDKKGLKHSSSSGGLHALNAMGLNLKPKSKKDSSPPRDIAVPQVSAPVKVKGGKKSPGLQPEPPSTSSGVMLASPTVVQIKKKRSMVSLFATGSGDASTSASGSLAGAEPQRRSPLGVHQVTTPPPQTLPERTSKTSATNKVSFEGDGSGQLFSSAHTFLPKDIWAKRRNMKLHPYHTEIPYMQAYDPMLLESDRYTDSLLLRLANNQPSFHDFGKRPPTTVLDLGCGEGNWAVNAASYWKDTEIVGLDIVDITLPAFALTGNLYFIQADFLERKLPFPAKRFDFVRMANLALCIPKDRWESLFQEVHRVLAPGGRLEVIDDQIQFPYAKKPAFNPVDEAGSASLDMFDTDDEQDVDGDTLQGHESGETDSTLVSDGSRPSSFDGKHSELSESATVRPLDVTKGQSMSEYLPSAPQHSTTRKSSIIRAQKRGRETRSAASESRRLAVEQQVHASKELEKIFRLMLRRQFGISYRPADRIVKYLHNVFGEESSGKKFSFHIKLAPGDVPPEIEALADSDFMLEKDDKGSTISGSSMLPSGTPQFSFDGVLSEKRRNWMGGDREKQKAKKADKERKKAELLEGDVASIISRSSSERSSSDSPATPAYPPSLNAKAAQRLGLTLPSTPAKQKGSLQGLGFQDLTTPTKVKTPSRRQSILRPTATISAAPFTPPPSMPVPPPLNYNERAAKRLGVNPDGTPVHIETRRRKPKKRPVLVQSPGLIVWPSTFIPLNPVELEMHATKNVHSLLGCRAALADFITSYTDEEGRRLVEDEEFDDIMWDYECFRRRRLNWPSEIVDHDDDDELNNASMFSSDSIPPKRASKSISPSPAGDSTDSFNGEWELTHVRTIRVFHAVKAGIPPSLNVF
ncbi:hypothetical protein BDN70DRAFT_16626 [Pholiota conissans]|uniref:Methyltransferase domain-containing protein n=1 Tax=Pholiota conissans TaxID=109636 RepID=A0A9P5ZHF9_9AGAR|nr:hypothetical protein BDN70DRAFT_16626 [Pholiota conissans]